MNHLGLTWHEIRKEISFQNLVMLSASVPQYRTKEQKEKSSQKGHIQNFLGLPPKKSTK